MRDVQSKILNQISQKWDRVFFSFSDKDLLIFLYKSFFHQTEMFDSLHILFQHSNSVFREIAYNFSSSKPCCAKTDFLLQFDGVFLVKIFRFFSIASKFYFIALFYNAQITSEPWFSAYCLHELTVVNDVFLSRMSDTGAAVFKLLCNREKMACEV